MKVLDYIKKVKFRDSIAEGKDIEKVEKLVLCPHLVLAKSQL